MNGRVKEGKSDQRRCTINTSRVWKWRIDDEAESTDEGECAPESKHNSCVAPATDD